jgi:ubiquinone/menaquinone biosynthesis C-methylase UbiE
MTKTRKPENYYELIGSDFDKFMSDYDVAQRVKKIRALIPKNFEGSTLEIGCGTGAVTKGYRDLVGALIVSDISERLAKMVAKKFNATGVHADAMSLPWSDSFFDLIISSECIEHTPSPHKSLEEMIRVCKPGGFVLVTTPNKLWYPVVRLSQLLRIRKFQGNEIFLSSGSIHRIFQDSNCQIIQQTGCHLFPWQLPFSHKLLNFLDKFGKLLYPLMINQIILARKL